MKSVLIAAVAALAIALPVHASDKAVVETTTPATAVTMSPADCKAKWDACGADEACKADLTSKGCKVDQK